jgi:hypothetical protein
VGWKCFEEARQLVAPAHRDSHNITSSTLREKVDLQTAPWSAKYHRETYSGSKSHHHSATFLSSNLVDNKHSYIN